MNKKKKNHMDGIYKTICRKMRKRFNDLDFVIGVEQVTFEKNFVSFRLRIARKPILDRPIESFHSGDTTIAMTQINKVIKTWVDGITSNGKSFQLIVNITKHNKDKIYTFKMDSRISNHFFIPTVLENVHPELTYVIDYSKAKHINIYQDEGLQGFSSWLENTLRRCMLQISMYPDNPKGWLDFADIV